MPIWLHPVKTSIRTIPYAYTSLFAVSTPFSWYLQTMNEVRATSKINYLWPLWQTPARNATLEYEKSPPMASSPPLTSMRIILSRLEMLATRPTLDQGNLECLSQSLLCGWLLPDLRSEFSKAQNRPLLQPACLWGECCCFWHPCEWWMGSIYHGDIQALHNITTKSSIHGKDSRLIQQKLSSSPKLPSWLTQRL